jgi:ribonuclease J
LITLITSNITRIQQALNVAVKSGRKVAFVGRSMENNVQVARDLGYLDVPPGVVAVLNLGRFFA